MGNHELQFRKRTPNSNHQKLTFSSSHHYGPSLAAFMQIKPFPYLTQSIAWGGCTNSIVKICAKNQLNFVANWRHASGGTQRIGYQKSTQSTPLDISQTTTHENQLVATNSVDDHDYNTYSIIMMLLPTTDKLPPPHSDTQGQPIQSELSQYKQDKLPGK